MYTAISRFTTIHRLRLACCIASAAKWPQVSALLHTIKPSELREFHVGCAFHTLSSAPKHRIRFFWELRQHLATSSVTSASPFVQESILNALLEVLPLLPWKDSLKYGKDLLLLDKLLDCTLPSGVPVLLWLAQLGFFQGIEHLMTITHASKRGKYINYHDKKHPMVLLIACRQGASPTVVLNLLKAGADPSIEYQDDTAFSYLCSQPYSANLEISTYTLSHSC